MWLFYGSQQFKVLMWPIIHKCYQSLHGSTLKKNNGLCSQLSSFHVVSRVKRINFCRSDTTRPVSGDITEAVIENSARQRLRTSSFGTRKMSSKQAVVIDNSINNATR